MNISYENTMNLAFDKPLTYKGLLLYPVKVPYYSIFATADSCLDVNKSEERDIRLLRLPYLDYIYEKSLIDESFKNKWSMLIGVLKIVLTDDQPFDVIREEGNIYIKVYQRSDKYELLNKEIEIMKEDFLEKYKDKKPTKEDLAKYSEILKSKQEEMYNTIKITSVDFEEIRQLIMAQNDIKSQHYDQKTEEFLNKVKKDLQSIQKSSSLDLEDLVTVVAYATGKTNSEIENMTIRRFNRFLQIIENKDDYYLYKQLELSGNIKMKKEIPYWIRHFKPKGKYDDVLIEDSETINKYRNGGKI